MSGATATLEATGAAVRSGACVSFALELNPESVSAARRRVRTISEGLGVPSTLADDLAVMTSELTTNAIAHGGDRVVYHSGRPVAGLPELWLYLRESRRPELVVAVFDTGDFWARTVRVPASGRDVVGVDGRGLQIIGALAEEARGRWGIHPSRSRLGQQRLPGTTVWVAVPVPESARNSDPVHVRPDEAIGRLVGLLRARGVVGLISRTTEQEAVLSLPGLTVWFRQGAFFWKDAAGPVRARAVDVVDVAEQILAETELIRRRNEMEGRC